MKYFGWFNDNYNYKTLSVYTPYFTQWTDIIGTKHICTEQELLKLNISDSKKKRIVSAKIGTRIIMSRLSSSSYLILKRLPDDTGAKIKERDNLREELDYIREKLNNIDIYKREKQIAKQLTVLNKELGC